MVICKLSIQGGKLMTLINFTKEELYKIEECINGDGDSYGDPVCESILEKIDNTYLEEVSK